MKLCRTRDILELKTVLISPPADLLSHKSDQYNHKSDYRQLGEAYRVWAEVCGSSDHNSVSI